MQRGLYLREEYETVLKKLTNKKVLRVNKYKGNKTTYYKQYYILSQTTHTSGMLIYTYTEKLNIKLTEGQFGYFNKEFGMIFIDTQTFSTIHYTRNCLKYWRKCESAIVILDLYATLQNEKTITCWREQEEANTR